MEEKKSGARWEGEFVSQAAEQFEATVVDADGVDDYQGWGSLLFTRPDGKFAAIGWSYGSCNHCDGYEDQEHLIADEVSEMKWEDEESARLAFGSCKGW